MVSQSDMGSMLLATVRYALRQNGFTADYTAGLLRRHFVACDDYDKRQIMTEIEVAVAVPRDVPDLDKWAALAEEIRPPKAPFTVDYRCSKCKAEGLKLWRGYGSGAELRCAKCLAPAIEVDADGRAACDLLGGQRSDQIASWLPAVPTDDTFWGYTSVPTADVRWWRALPTYRASQSESVDR